MWTASPQPKAGRSTAVDQFAPGAAGLVQSLEASGLVEGGGVAVDDQTGTVFASDAASGDLDVFRLEGPGKPVVEGLQALAASSASPYARSLSAQVNPAGSVTHYYFEYGSEGCASSPGACTISPSRVLGEGFSGFGDRLASWEASGLAPGTYHYRVIVENAFGTVTSPEREFTVIGAVLSGLPDGRAWEMVSPPNKRGASIEALTREGGAILAAEDGDALAYVANGAISEEAQGNRSLNRRRCSPPVVWGVGARRTSPRRLDGRWGLTSSLRSIACSRPTCRWRWLNRMMGNRRWRRA